MRSARAWIVGCALAACGGQDEARAPAVKQAPARAAPVAEAPPSPRLSDDATPLAYELRLDLDPERETFFGRVEIRVRLARATTKIWLHAVQLDFDHATVGDQVATDEAGPDQRRALVVPRAVGPGEVTIAIDYDGKVATEDKRDKRDAQGLFREVEDGRWYLYSQGESVFARRIAPCFDEPRWKVPWRVTLAVPRGQVALANAPLEAERALPGDRRELRFAETGPLPSYLVAVAVGPFALVDAGRVGRNKIPARFAVAHGDAARARAAIKDLPRLVDALEAYFDAPLPWPKLDFVSVPRFFGAMENPGLVTFDAENLVGPEGDAGERGADRSTFLHIAGHELAHFWVGDSVTPAWWSDLWLSEAFATWLEQRVSEQLGGRTSHALERHADRQRALDADSAAGAQPLRREVRSAEDAEEQFGAIAYEKGAAVIAMFEHFLGEAPFRDVVRAYVRAHANGSATATDFVAALAAADPRAAEAFTSYLDRAGTPVVDLELACDAHGAMLAASARGGFTVPVCARTPTETKCALVGARTELPLAACPAWVIGNADSLGYYQVVWRGAAHPAPLKGLRPEEILAAGDDAAAALERGDLSLPDALAALRRLAESRDATAQLAALSIARAVDPLVIDLRRHAWQAWLGARFRDRLTLHALMGRDSTEVNDEIGEQLLDLVGPEQLDPKVIARAKQNLAAGTPSPWNTRIAGGDAEFKALAKLVGRAENDDEREAYAFALGQLPAEYAHRIVQVVVDNRLHAAALWPAIGHLLRRGDARTYAWDAVYANLAELVVALPLDDLPRLVSAVGGLCTREARAQVVDAFGARAKDSLARIDLCIARRTAVGDVAEALAAP